jgi:hypothetical protein
VADARRPAAQKAHGTVETEGGSARTPVSEVSSAVLSPTTRIGAIVAISTQEDWLHTVTADPAFWLKEVS